MRFKLSVRLRRLLVGGIILAGLMTLVVQLKPRLEQGQTEVLHVADDIWVDVNNKPACSLSPDRTWLIFGRVEGTDSYRSTGPAAVVARNLNTGEERTLIPIGIDGDDRNAMGVLWRLNESVWSADTLVVRARDSWQLLVPASGSVTKVPLKSRPSQRPTKELLRRVRARFQVPIRSDGDLAWDRRSLGGYFYYTEKGDERGERLLNRIARDGRWETVKTLQSTWADWFISDLAVSPNGRWVALRAVRTPRFSPGYLFFAIPVIGYHGVDHLIVVDTATGESRDYGKLERLHSLQWLPDSRHLVYVEEEIRGPVWIKMLQLPATEIDPDEPRVPWGRKVKQRRSPSVAVASREPILPVGWVSLDFGKLGFSYPGNEFRVVGGDSALVLTREVDGQVQAAYKIDMHTELPEDYWRQLMTLPPAPGFGIAALSGWLSDQRFSDPSQERVFAMARGDGEWIRVERLAGVTRDYEQQVTYRILASFDVEGRRGY